MPTMELESTYKRIDDLNARMTEGFGRVHREVAGLGQRMTEGFERLDGEINRLDQRMTEGFERVDLDIRELRGGLKDLHSETSARFDAMHRTMMRGFFALGGIMLTLFLAHAGMQGF